MLTLTFTGLAAVVCAHAGSFGPPVVEVTKPGFVVSSSCVISIPEGVVLADADGAGAIRIGADNVEVTFKEGTILQGAAPDVAGDKLVGTAIRIDGHTGVTIKGAKVRGYKVGIHATRAADLMIDGAEFMGNYRQHLRSTPSAEDGGDWLFPHHNDNNEWTVQHGAAISIRESNGVVVRNVKVREGQNGILINRVNDSKFYDNDCSFLSGWGLGMFRSSRNIITRNALDFCVRGHVEGVYNRGQDSAGILCFEQCSNNTFAENSVTHGGDGFFAFAGLEALNGEGAPKDFDFTRKGCNENLFIGNDFSYAPAHGLELTFSFGNQIIHNTFTENAICGVWGGFSQDTLIEMNKFEGNGGMGYGLERGGINIEHGANNHVIANEFINNKCGIHYWYHENKDFRSKTWGKANYKGVVGNEILLNSVVINDNHPFKNLRPTDKLVFLHVRDDQPSSGFIKPIIYAGNTMNITSAAGVEKDVAPGVTLVDDPKTNVERFHEQYEVLGITQPVGARRELAGRDKIIMTEWGPWDHQSPLVRLASSTSTTHTYELYNMKGDPQVTVKGEGMSATVVPADAATPNTRRVTIVCASPASSIAGYSATITDGSFSSAVEGTFFSAAWDVTFFPWTKGDSDPREKLDAWHALATSSSAKSTKLSGPLVLKYAGGGPSTIGISPDITKAGFKNDYFGTIARTQLTLPKGTYRVKTLTDDGIRVFVDGKVVLEDWTWHGPTAASKEFTVDHDGPTPVVVEHFEIDGYSVLDVQFERVK